MTTAFDTEAAKQEGAKPRGLIQIDLPTSGTIYISDQQITIGANTYRPLVKNWGDIFVEEGSTGNFDITLLNHDDASYGRFSVYEKTNILTNASIRFYRWFEGLVAADMYPEFEGAIDSYTYNINEITLSVNDGSHMEHKKLPEKTLSYYSYTNARQDDIGKYFPIAYGEPGEALNTQKINKGYGSAPALLINKSTRKYLVAGHASFSVPSAVWVALSGISDGYAYIEGCTGNTNDSGYSTVVLPEDLYCGYFLSAMTSGNYFTNTAQNPDNVCDRDTTTTATLNTTYPLLDVAVGSINELGTLAKVLIATSALHTGCRTRWAGPRAYLYAACSSGATSITIDSGKGFDASGFMEINGDRFSYTSLTEDSTGSFWTVSGIPATGGDSIGTAHSISDPAIMVGPWYTLSSAEIDVTSDRDWSSFDFYKFEIIVEWQSGTDYTPSYVGFRVEFELSEYPDIYVPLKGHILTNRRNAAEQIKHIYTNYLGRAAGDIGSTFTTAISDLEALTWKTDLSIHDQENSRDIIETLKKECKGRLWLDGEGKVHLKIFKFGELASKTINYDTDIIDADGEGFEVTVSPVDEIYNEVYLNFAYDYAGGDYTKQYYITPTEAAPADSTRVTRASQSKTDYKTTNRLTIDAPHVQDATTALNLLQHYFDYYYRQRKIVNFTVSLKYYTLAIGDIIWLYHVLGDLNKAWEVTKVVKNGNTRVITAREYGSQSALSDTATFTDAVSMIYGQGYGKDGNGSKLGGNWLAA